MSKQTVTVYLFMLNDYDLEQHCFAWKPDVWTVKVSESERRIFVSEQTVEIEVPDNFDPREKQIAALEAQRRDITAKFQASVTEINRRISELQAIAYEA